MQSRTRSPLCIVLMGLGISEVHQHAVAHVLGHEPAETLHSLGDARRRVPSRPPSRCATRLRECTTSNNATAPWVNQRPPQGLATRAVLDGFPIPTDPKIVRYPDRYMDKRGDVMWRRVTRLLAQFEGVERVA